MTEVSESPDRILAVDTPSRSGLSGADSDTLSTFKTAAGDARDCDGRSAIALWGVFDNSAADEATVEVLFFNEDDGLVLITDPVTLSAAATKDENGEYVSPRVLVPNLGLPKYRVKLTALTGNEVDIYAGTTS